MSAFDADLAVLVEGESDRQALLALASLMGRDLTQERIEIVAMGGATNVSRFVKQYGPQGGDIELAGMCDVAETPHVVRALSLADLVSPSADQVELEAAGFFVCNLDLEDELIRAMGADEMLAFIESQGELGTFTIFQKQPAQRARTLDQHLHRFCGIRSGRKVRYAKAMVEWLSAGRVPLPLRALLHSV